MKLTEISISTHNQKDCLPLLLVLGAMVWIAALPVQVMSAQSRPEIVWSSEGYGDLADAMEESQSMKGFVEKHSKRVKKQPSGGSVHVVYLVPSDKRPRRDYAAAVKRAILEMEAFYQEELGISRSIRRKTVGETFDTFAPTVQIVQTPHDSTYYNANNQAGQFQFFFRAVEDGFAARAAGSMIRTLSGSSTSTRIQLAAKESAERTALRCFPQMI